MKKIISILMCIIAFGSYSQTEFGFIGSVNFDANSQMLLDRTPVGFGLIFERNETVCFSLFSFGKNSTRFSLNYGNSVFSKDDFDIIPTIGLDISKINSIKGINANIGCLFKVGETIFGGDYDIINNTFGVKFGLFLNHNSSK